MGANKVMQRLKEVKRKAAGADGRSKGKKKSKGKVKETPANMVMSDKVTSKKKK